MPEYTKDQLWKLYDKLPSELQEAVFSEETAGHLDDICKRYSVAEGKVSEVAKYVGRVLLGVLPPEDFQTALEKEVVLARDAAKQIAHEINRFVFAPVKDQLNQIYHIGTTAPAKTASAPEMMREPAETPAGIPQKPSEASKADVYREGVE